MTQQTNGQQTFGAILFLAAVALGIYGWVTVSAGPIVLAFIVLAGSVGAFASGKSKQRDTQLGEISRKLDGQ